jgi:hypothetical protein
MAYKTDTKYLLLGFASYYPIHYSKFAASHFWVWIYLEKCFNDLFTNMYNYYPSNSSIIRQYSTGMLKSDGLLDVPHIHKILDDVLRGY